MRGELTTVSMQEIFFGSGSITYMRFETNVMENGTQHSGVSYGTL